MGCRFDGCNSSLRSGGLGREQSHQDASPHPPPRLKRSPCDSCGEAYVSKIVVNFPLSEVRNTFTVCVKQDADELKFKMSLMNNSLNVCK